VPLPWVAIMLGWTMAEVGRQPWVVYDLMLTSAGASPTVGAAQVAASLGLFVIIYGLLFIAWGWLMTSFVRKGPERVPAEPATAAGGVAAAGAQGR
jgi:cytochrome d ubiquinol oxidase subunit I